MASYRSYGDTGAYRSRASIGIGSTFGRNTSGGSSLPSCRSSYSGVGSSSARAAAKERVLASFGGAFLKKDKLEEKPSFKYSCTKDTDKGRLYSGRSSSEDTRAKSPLSGSKSSLFEKYSFSAGKTSERPSSVLDRYNRPASREKSREPEGISRYGSSTYPGSSFGRSYGNDGRIEKKDHPPSVSYRGLRPNSGRASREPSPEVAGGGKTNSFRVYSRAPSYGRSAASPSTSESSSATISTRFGSTAAGSRFLSSRSGNERVPSAVNYYGADRFRGSSGKSANPKDEEEYRQLATKPEDGSHESPKVANRMEDGKSDNRLADNEFLTLTIVTRGTSPTPPASSSYVRNRRAEIGIVHQKEVARPRELPDTLDKETQCDRSDETSRFSRFSGSNRVSGAPSWSAYLDKYSSSSGAAQAGSSSMYSSRGFNNTSSSSARLNSFAYRTNEATRHEFAAKESSTSTQETHSNRSQNETVLGGANRSGNENSSVSNEDTKTCGQDTRGANKETSKNRVQSNEQCCCNARKAETSRSPGISRTSSQDLAFQRREDSTGQDCRERHSEDRSKDRQSPVLKCDGCNQRRASIPRFGRSSPKSEVKIPKCSSKPDLTKTEVCERRESKPDVNSRSRIEESRIVEGLDQSEEVISQKHDVSQRKESSGAAQSRPAPTSQSRGASTKTNTPRQMTRTGSSDGSSSASLPIGRSKSSSASSVANQGVKIKATTPPSSSGKSTGGTGPSPSVNLRQGGSPDARGKPPVPKNDTTTAATPKCIVAAKYVNKDFRKSTLNMENGDPSRSKYTRRKKGQRNISGSSQDSETTSEHVGRVASSGSSTSIKSARSRLRAPSGGSKHGMAGRCSDSNASMRWEDSRSGSKSPCGTTKRPSGTSSSSSSSRSTSANSSSSEDNDERVDRPGSRRRRRRASESPMRETRGKISAGSSKTSVLASSADEIPMMTEKPPRPPSSPRSKSDRSAKTEEAKSFLMRALAPVTNFFKSKSQDSGDTSKSGGWVDSNDENYEASNKTGQPLSSSRSISLSKAPSFTNSDKSDRMRERGHARIQRQYSGERPWWLDSNSDNIPLGIERTSPWNDDASQDTTISTVLPDDGKCKFKVWRQESGERAWWLDEVSAEEAKKSPASSTSRRGSSRGSFRSADRRNRIRHQQSGERAWWMSDDPENVPEGVEVIPVASPDSQGADMPDGSVDNETLYSAKPLNKIRHIESGEKAWWMDSCSNVPDGVVRIPVETSNSTSDSSESYEKIDIGVNPEPETCVKRSLSRFPIEFPPPPPEEPLGDRASPEGVENPPDPPDNYGGRDSPYDNVQPTPRRLSPRKRPSTLPLFISEHTDIDDVLSDTAVPCHSPVLSRVRKQERVEEDSSEDSSECEEIDATQVIIHDSTPKTPMIQRRNRENERIQPDGYIPVSFVVLLHVNVCNFCSCNYTHTNVPYEPMCVRKCVLRSK